MNRTFNPSLWRYAMAACCSTFLSAGAWAQLGTAGQPLPLSKSNPGQYTYQPTGAVIFNSAATSMSPGNMFSASNCGAYSCWVGTNQADAVNSTNPTTNQSSLNVTRPGAGSYANGAVIPWPIESQIKIQLVSPYIATPVQSTGAAFKFGKRYRIQAVITPAANSVPGLLRIGIGDSVIPNWAARTFLVAAPGVSAPAGTTPVSCPQATNGVLTCTYSFTFNRPNEVTGKNVLYLIPQVAGMNVYIDSIRIDEISADPFNLAADLPRPPNLAGTPTVGNQMMGLKFGQWSYNGGVWPAGLGATMNRLWDTGTYWGAVQPSTSGWSISALSKWSLFDANNNAETLLTLGLTPPWATLAQACGITYYPSPPGCFEPPSNISTWYDYVTKMAISQGGLVQYFELWNEPNIDFNADGNGLKLSDLAKSARLALNAAQVQLKTPLKLVGPSMTNVGMDYLDQFLASGGGASIDVFSYHAYFKPVNAENSLSSETANVRLALYDYGYNNKPLWNTETGAECDPGTLVGCPGNATPTKDVTRGIIPRAAATLYLNGVTNFDYYHLEGTENTGQPWRALATPNPNPATVAPSAAGYGSPQYTVLTDNGTGYKIASTWLSSTARAGVGASGAVSGATTGWQVSAGGVNYPVYVMPIYNGTKQQYMVWNYSSSPLFVSVPASDWGLKGMVNLAYSAKVHTVGVNPIGVTTAGEDSYRLYQPTYAPAGNSPPPAWSIWLMPYSPVLLTPQ